MKQEVISYLHTIKDEIYKLTKFLYDNPEKSYHETKACNLLIETLKNNNFKVIPNYLDISTAFYAEYGNDYPRICFFCDYDAVPDKGHIHGHNLSSAISCSAAISLSKVVDKIGGTIIVLGSPGEYVGGAKVTMAKQGIFNDMDVAMMVHPDILTAESGTSKAILPLCIKFTSNDGVTYLKSNSLSPLDACLFVLNGLNVILKGYNGTVQIDTLLENGGYTPSLPHDVCEIRLYIRAVDYCTAEQVKDQIKKLVEASSATTNISGEVKINELPYCQLTTNKTLSRIFSHNLKELGVIDSCGVYDIEAGISMGTVSEYVPCIHPFIQITDSDDISYGSPDFAAATLSSFAQERAITAAAALAITAVDIIQKETILSKIKEEFYASKKK
ncbi:M20 family metallopeptidase [Clostridium thermarum]|uniref:M20 family metallopeptidase n=1 Tax=Clostridium thermarum TaxID=1716543 RepID=UPI0013D126AB|nr:M20 family metallopeptidase [Clostridium thermarum]